MGALWALIFVCEVNAQTRSHHSMRTVALTKEDAAQAWSRFTKTRTANYAMRFSIEHAPRRGESSFYDGIALNQNKGRTSLTRILVKKNGEQKESVEFLLENSPQKKRVWKFENGKALEVPQSDWGKPILRGLIYSPVDLLSPYTSWDYRYAGGGRIGQAVHFFDTTPPEENPKVKIGGDEIGKVRIALSREFNHPVAVETYAKDGKLLKTFSLGSVKKIDGFWMAKTLQVKDELTKAKDIIRFTSANMEQTNSAPEVFSQNSLGKAIKLPIMKEL